MTNTGETRRRELDGLRGIAALVVVIHHCLLVDPAVSDAFYGAPGSRFAALITNTPLRVLWAGDTAVVLFFVLSGYVLARPFLAGRGGAWGAYYGRRLLRLYLPVWAAVAVAVALLAVVPRVSPSGRSLWVDAQAVPVTVHSLLGTLTLWAPDTLVAPLWSLRWEVLFSLTLPLYLAGAVWLRRFPLPVALVAMLAASGVGWAVGVDGLRYLPVFALGVLLADREEALAGIMRRGRMVSAAVLLTAVALAASRSYPALAVGALLLVALALTSPTAQALLAHRVPLWLGRVSFSLYLTHILFVLTLATVLPAVPAVALTPLAVAASLLFAAGFHRLVEAPAQRLAGQLTRKKSKYDSTPPSAVSSVIPTPMLATVKGTV